MRRSLFLVIVLLLLASYMNSFGQNTEGKANEKPKIARENTATFKGTGFGDPARNISTRGAVKGKKVAADTIKIEQKQEEENVTPKEQLKRSEERKNYNFNTEPKEKKARKEDDKNETKE